jgi:cytochrome c-type biogenesis protein CcmH
MTLFWIAALLLTLLTALVLVLPLWRGSGGPAGQDMVALNRRVFRERLAELERDRAEGRTDEATFVELRTELERNMLSLDAGDPAASANRFTPRGVTVAALVLLPVLAFGFYYGVVMPQGLPGWWKLRAEMGPSVDKILRGEAPSAADAQGHTMADFVRLLQDRLQRDPKNDQGWFMLGIAYMQLELPQPASTAFEHAWRLDPEEPRYALLYAQSRIFGNEGQLEPVSRGLLESVLAKSPDHESALLMYGLASYRGGDHATAVQKLDRLQQLRGARGEGDGGSPLLAQLDATLADARARLKQAGAGTTAAAALRVKVRVDRALAGKYSPDDTLYVFARALAGPPMPLAVVKRRAGELPLTIDLDDSQSMMPQRPLSSVQEITVTARISRHGSPEPQPGDLEAVAVPVRQSGKAQAVELVIQSAR